MRKIVAAAAAALVVPGLAGCEAPEMVDTPVENVDATGGAPADGDETTAPTDDDPAGQEEPAVPGDTITADTADTTLDVTVLEVYDPATTGEFGLEPEGRYVAVELHLANVGDATYRDTPANGAVLVDVDGRTTSSTFGEVEECAAFASGQVTLAPDDARVGCVMFDVPADVELAAFELTGDSGFAGTTTRFDLAGYATGDAPPRDDLTAGSSGDADATIGDTLELQSEQASAVLAVTVPQVVDPAAPGEFGVDAEGRYVAVELTLEHVSGDDVYEDSPSNGAVLVDVDGRTYAATFADPPDCSGFADGQVRLAPGDSRTGCVVFDVPADVRLAVFEFTLDSGFAAQSGRWSFGG